MSLQLILLGSKRAAHLVIRGSGPRYDYSYARRDGL